MTPNLFFERGSQCTDEAQRCEYTNDTDGRTLFTFGEDKVLPANFFCVFNFNQPEDYKNFYIGANKTFSDDTNPISEYLLSRVIKFNSYRAGGKGRNSRPANQREYFYNNTYM